MIQDYNEGGLMNLDLCFLSALKSSWVKRMFSQINSKFVNLYENQFN